MYLKLIDTFGEKCNPEHFDNLYHNSALDYAIDYKMNCVVQKLKSLLNVP